LVFIVSNLRGFTMKKTLNTVLAGVSACVVTIDAGRCATTRLESLGVYPGTELAVVVNAGRGPMIISIGDGRLILERGIASKVIVH
jgi:ferrous iron transport protein A